MKKMPKNNGLVTKNCMCGRKIIVEEPDPGQLKKYRCACGRYIEVWGRKLGILESFTHKKIKIPSSRVYT